MAKTNITLSMEEDAIEQDRQAAKAEGLTLSAFYARSARRERLRINGRLYREYIDGLTGEDAAARDAWLAHATREILPERTA